ncbi:MAG: glycosyltransferase family 4 protein [Candidatus Binatus sp.]
MRALNIFISHPSPFLTDHQPHGDGLAAWEFVSRLARRGHKVHVAAAAFDIKGDLPPHLSIHPYRLRAPLAAMQPLEAMVKIRAIFKRIARGAPFDLIQQLNPVYPGLSAGLLRMGVPLVLGPFVPMWPQSDKAPGGSIRRGWRSAFDRIIERANLAQERAAAALILTTQAAASALREPERCGLRMFVLPYGVDTQRFVPAPEGSLSDGPSVLFLANLYARKGIYTLLEAFETVAVAIPRCRLDIAGDGPEAGGVRGKITAMASRAGIRMIGAVSRDRVAEVMRSCAVFCVPSHGEPFGLTALEAMACGKPVVGTDTGGLAYLVDAPRGGRKVPVGDAEALATVLIEILSEPGLAESMGRHNRRFAVENYDWEYVIDRLEKVYDSVLSA